MSHTIKIHNHKIPWEKIRETIVVILGLIFMAAAFFQFGFIVRDLRTDNTLEKYHTLDRRVMSIDGRLTAIEGPQKDQKAVGRRQ